MQVVDPRPRVRRESRIVVLSWERPVNYPG
jgi:hypothetical protein